jgi:RimJ/RimL family protein N-acetyltransferase
LRNIIRKFSRLQNCIFLRILEKKQHQHIGNIKYHPIDLNKRIAVMGILIGEQFWRGKGVAKEVINNTAKYLHTKAGIRRILLGVAKNNIPAIRAYKKTGFKIKNCWANGKKPLIGQIIMDLKLRS